MNTVPIDWLIVKR